MNTNISIIINAQLRHEGQSAYLITSSLANSINIQNLIVLLNHKVKKSDYTLNAQINALNIFFNTVLIPKLFSFTSCEFSNELLLSPIHRLLLFKDDKLYFKEIGGKNKFFELISLIVS